MSGFCAISKSLPLPRDIETEIAIPAVEGNGLNAAYNTNIFCLVAEPHATILRIALTDSGQEVAFETSIIGRLRYGYRVVQLRSLLGTRIEICFLFVRISFSSTPNLWAAPRQQERRFQALHKRIKELEGQAAGTSEVKLAL
jgi:hypothetical protein